MYPRRNRSFSRNNHIYRISATSWFLNLWIPLNFYSGLQWITKTCNAGIREYALWLATSYYDKIFCLNDIVLWIKTLVFNNSDILMWNCHYLVLSTLHNNCVASEHIYGQKSYISISHKKSLEWFVKSVVLWQISVCSESAVYTDFRLNIWNILFSFL